MLEALLMILLGVLVTVGFVGGVIAILGLLVAYTIKVLTNLW
jgi:hypothetical protein